MNEGTCGPIDNGEATRAVVSRVPGRKGYYLIIESGGTSVIVARLFGTTEAQQDTSRRRLLAWAEGRTIT